MNRKTAIQFLMQQLLADIPTAMMIAKNILVFTNHFMPDYHIVVEFFAEDSTEDCPVIKIIRRNDHRIDTIIIQEDNMLIKLKTVITDLYRKPINDIGDIE